MAAIMFDKSAFQALTAEAHGRCMFIFQENITPILLTEILADLSKDPANTLRWTPGLARKFNGSGGTIGVDWQLPCEASLSGKQEPPMNGQILVSEWSEGIGPSGELEALIDVTDGNRAILRWASGTFDDDEHKFAERFRKASEAFQLDTLIGRLRGRVSPVYRLPQLQGAVDAVLDTPDMQRLLIDWLIDQLRSYGAVRALRTVTVNRWHLAGHPLLKDFAPYAHHCARVLLMFIMGDPLLKQRVTNRLDVEYLLYLPFCHVFVSDDEVHQKLAPLLLRPDQRWIRSQALIADPKQVAKEANERVDFSSDRPWV